MATLVEKVRAAGIRVAMLAVPAAAAQEATDRLVEAGVKAILNYAPTALSVPMGVYVQNIDPAAHMQRMTFHLEG
jgi:redox-sensing transcriptional repressor